MFINELREKSQALIDAIENTEEHGDGADEEFCSICTAIRELKQKIKEAPLARA